MIQSTEIADMLGITVQQVNNMRNRHKLKDEEDTFLSKTNRRYYGPKGIRKFLKKKGYKFRRKNVCVCNVKGGVGKTTISVGLANRAAKLGFKTLLVDCDKQGNATDQIWPSSRERDFACLYDIIKSNSNFDDAVVGINDFLSLLPSNLKNQLLEIEIISKNINKGRFFKRFLDKAPYDLVIFDTEPNLSQINLMALAYSDINIAPIKTDKNSIDGLELLLSFIEQQQKEWPDMNVETMALINGFDKRMTTEALKKIGDVQTLGISAFDSVVRIDQNFVKSQDSGTLKKNSKAYEDIAILATELLELGPKKNLQ